MTEKKRPTYDAFLVDGDGKNAFWTKIGAAWPHEDGKGLNVQLVALPISGRIALRKPLERNAEDTKEQAPARKRK